LNGYNPDVNGNSPGTFSCNTQRRISPHASYFGKAILGICKCDNDSECVWILISLSRTMNEYTGFLYLFTFSSQPVMTSQLYGSKSLFSVSNSANNNFAKSAPSVPTISIPCCVNCGAFPEIVSIVL